MRKFYSKPILTRRFATESGFLFTEPKFALSKSSIVSIEIHTYEKNSPFTNKILKDGDEIALITYVENSRTWYRWYSKGGATYNRIDNMLKDGHQDFCLYDSLSEKLDLQEAQKKEFIKNEILEPQKKESIKNEILEAQKKESIKNEILEPINFKTNFPKYKYKD